MAMDLNVQVGYRSTTGYEGEHEEGWSRGM